LGDHPHSLLAKDISDFAKMTEYYSVEDIVNVIKETVHSPLRRLTTAKLFKEVNNKYQPCR
jgi:SpoVK/Ycf46/Vps4 family AAA+-type ATPase